MEVKINREIKDYAEAVYFGLSLRQFIFSLLACGIAVGVYFILKPFFGLETLSWVSVFASSPPVVDTTAAAVNQVWKYVGELIFNMLVLVGTIKMSDRVVHEMIGV